MNDKIFFRPHHFLCTISYRGLGYSDQFTANYDQITRRLKSDENTTIEVVNGADGICGACPHLTLDHKCDHEAKIQKLDSMHLQILGIQYGSQISWREAKQLIAKNFTLEAFHKACKGCAWKSLGVCEQALSQLKLEC